MICFSPQAYKVLSQCVVDERGCFLYQGKKIPFGYGRLTWRGKEKLTHRLVKEPQVGRLSPEVCVLHKCDVPACCNPEHLFLGDRAVNMQDMAKKKRGNWQQKDHCIRGHLFDGVNKRQRTCSMCLAENDRRHKRKKRAQKSS